MRNRTNGRTRRVAAAALLLATLLATSACGDDSPASRGPTAPTTPTLPADPSTCFENVTPGGRHFEIRVIGANAIRVSGAFRNTCSRAIYVYGNGRGGAIEYFLFDRFGRSLGGGSIPPFTIPPGQTVERAEDLTGQTGFEHPGDITDVRSTVAVDWA